MNSGTRINLSISKYQYYFTSVSFWKLKADKASLVRVDVGTPTLLDALHPLYPRFGGLSGTVESVADGAEGFGSAGGAGLKGAPVLVNVPRNEEGIALSVAEAVDDGPAEAAILTESLLQRLRLTPVHAQVPALRDVQRLLAGLEHLFHGRGGDRSSPTRHESSDRGRKAGVRIVWRGGFVWMRQGALESCGIRAFRRAEEESQYHSQSLSHLRSG